MSSFWQSRLSTKMAHCLCYPCIHNIHITFPSSPICQNLLQRNFPKHFDDRQQGIGRHVTWLVFTPVQDYDFAVSSSAVGRKNIYTHITSCSTLKEVCSDDSLKHLDRNQSFFSSDGKQTVCNLKVFVQTRC